MSHYTLLLCNTKCIYVCLYLRFVLFFMCMLASLAPFVRMMAGCMHNVIVKGPFEPCLNTRKKICRLSIQPFELDEKVTKVKTR